MNDDLNRQQDDAPYAVGFGRPPKEHQFKKGQISNRKGRERGSKNLSTLLKRTLDERVTVKDKTSGKKVTKTKRELIIAQLVNGSANADLRALSLLLPMMKDIEVKETEALHKREAADAAVHEDDAKVMAALKVRFARSGGSADE